MSVTTPVAPVTESGESQSVAVSVPDARGAKKQAFALTPLADVMFQLLIFFMLSTSLAPYALIPLGVPEQAVEDDSLNDPVEPPENTDAEAPRPPEIWHVGRGTLRSGRDIFRFTDLEERIALYRQAGGEEVLLFTTRNATTQDVATVLEAAKTGGLTRVRLVGRPGGL